jgi:hypothetical protein
LPFTAQKKYFALKTKILRSKQFFICSKRFSSAQTDFQPLKTIFKRSNRIFDCNPQFSRAYRNFQLQLIAYRLPLLTRFRL